MFAVPTGFSDFLVQSIKTLPYLAVFIGPLFICIGLWMDYSASQFLKTSLEVEVLVTNIEERRDEDGTVYRPTFEVEAADGNRVRYVGNTWVSPKPHEAGEIVSGRYNSEDGVIRSDVMLAQTQFLSSGLMRVGGVVSALGVGFFAWRRFSSKQT